MVRDEGAACVPRPLNETWENLHSVDHHPVLHDALDMCLPPLHVASDREHNSVCSFSSPDLSDDSDAENHKWSGGLSVAEGIDSPLSVKNGSATLLLFHHDSVPRAASNRYQDARKQPGVIVP